MAKRKSSWLFDVVAGLREPDDRQFFHRGLDARVDEFVQAAARGEITPGEASDLCGVLDGQRRAIELSEIEARLAKLEALQNPQHGARG